MPKDSLLGLSTDSGWRVTQKLDSKLGSGGNFCSRYLVEKDGKQGFLKAMDLHESFGDLQEMKKLIDRYLFEQEIAQYCADRRMTRVVTPFDTGKVVVPQFQAPQNVVYYVIFERADGDLRNNHLDAPRRAWVPVFSALHHVAIGIDQLHRARIAHQDIKPSNILEFASSTFKVADLGRVVDREGKSPFSGTHYPGDKGYQPLEMYFGVRSLDFSDRLSCDMFMVGSLIYQIVQDIQLNVVVVEEIKRLNPEVMHSSYEEALPYIQSAFSQVLKDFQQRCAEVFGDKLATIIHAMVYEMCNPDIEKRGERKQSSKLGRLQLNRYVSKLDRVVKTLAINGIA